MPNPSVQLYPYLFQPSSCPPIAAEWGQQTVPEIRLVRESLSIAILFVRFLAF